MDEWAKINAYLGTLYRLEIINVGRWTAGDWDLWRGLKHRYEVQLGIGYDQL